MKLNKTGLRIVLPILAVTLLAACASIGRPEGGPKDELPPVYVRSNPAPGSLNFSGDHLAIYFDENIKVEDVMNKVVVSPVMTTPPRVTGNGHRLSVQFQDTLRSNATYTVDFSDAIRDLNEGNILDGFAFDFSTGPTRDTLVISGMLFEARNLEPAQGMLVGVYSNLSDTALTTLPLDRIAKTNQYGQFVIRNLAPGEYNLFAINDLNRDYHWDRSEDVAFLGTVVSPTVEPIEVTDTLAASDGTDSIATRPGIRYLPNDLLLTWFNENYKSQYLKNNTRLDSLRLEFEFGAPSDTFPTFTLLNTPAAGKTLSDIALLDHSWGRDTLTYWLRDSAVIASDTLRIEARYLKTDTLDCLSWTVDTLRIINKNKPKPQAKKKKKEAADTIVDSIPKVVLMTFNPSVSGNLDLHRPLRFRASQPVDTIIESGIHLEVLRDTLWTDLGPQKLVRDSANRLLDYTLHHSWEPESKYRFTADSASIIGIYGNPIGPVKQEFTTKKLEDYSTISFSLSGYEPGQNLVVELLNSSDKPVAIAPAVGGEVKFEYLEPSTYFARAFIDANGNGQWDTGNIALKIQPEETYYYPKKLALKKNWDIMQSWNINELPIDLQKPREIKKNKPKTKEKEPVYDDEENEEEDDFYNSGFGSGGGNRGGNRGTSPNRTGGGGLRQSTGSLRR